MANINVTPGSGKTVATETIAGLEYGQVKILGGQTGSTSVWGINPDNSAQVSVVGTVKVTGSVVAVFTNTSLNVGSVIGAVGLYAQPGAFVAGTTSVITGTSSIVVLGAPGAAIRNYVTQMLVSNNAGVATAVNIVDNGQVIYAGYAAANGGGFAATFPTPLKQPSTNLGLYVQTPTQASVLVAFSGYIAP